MPWPQLVGALAVILLIAALIWLVVRRHAGLEGSIEEPHLAAEAAQQAIAGFRPVGALVGEDHAAALVIGASGRVAAVKRKGKRLTVREARWDQVRATHAGILVESAGRGPGDILIAGTNVLDIKHLAASPDAGGPA